MNILKNNWLGRLKSGLSKTSTKLNDGITGIFTKRKLDQETLSGLEELLIESDMGAAAAAKIIAGFGKQRLDKEISVDEIRKTLAQEISVLLKPAQHSLVIDKSLCPHVILVVGVNGNGKTTTIGKLAQHFKQSGHHVMLAAVDTFRAAAVEQLKIWSDRTGCEVITGEPNADPASVAYKALEEAKKKKADILIIDSAGRLQNKMNLMAELQKIIKVIKKMDEKAPHTVLQVLDATTGQNALSQVDVFLGMAHVTGLIVTKLDGTAKGGVIVAIAEKFKLPIYYIGVGEGIEDLQPFNADDFARNLTKTASS
jgi:fused signal recognition particle receptor